MTYKLDFSHIPHLVQNELSEDEQATLKAQSEFSAGETLIHVKTGATAVVDRVAINAFGKTAKYPWTHYATVVIRKVSKKTNEATGSYQTLDMLSIKEWASESCVKAIKLLTPEPQMSLF